MALIKQGDEKRATIKIIIIFQLATGHSKPRFYFI